MEQNYTRWFIAGIGVNFLLVVGMFFFFNQKLESHEAVINNQGTALQEVVTFLQQAISQSQGTAPQEPAQPQPEPAPTPTSTQ